MNLHTYGHGDNSVFLARGMAAVDEEGSGSDKEDDDNILVKKPSKNMTVGDEIKKEKTQNNLSAPGPSGNSKSLHVEKSCYSLNNNSVEDLEANTSKDDTLHDDLLFGLGIDTDPN